MRNGGYGGKRPWRASPKCPSALPTCTKEITSTSPALWAVENDITAGTSATTFGPGQTCTRGQIVTFLYKHYAQ